MARHRVYLVPEWEQDLELPPTVRDSFVFYYRETWTVSAALPTLCHLFIHYLARSSWQVIVGRLFASANRFGRLAAV
jgi:hypothetical protein